MANKYFFAGHETLANRGCEALLRGISIIIRERQSEAEFLAPSFDAENDLKQLTRANDMGVHFIPTYGLPFYARVWGRANKAIPGLKRMWIPCPDMPEDIRQDLHDTTAGIMTGGDVLSLDYGILSLIKWVGQAESYMADGRPMYLWAASVGTFESNSDIEQYVIRHLAAYAGISVRETSSYEYLEKLGLRNVKLVADPAFVMFPEAWDTSAALPSEFGEGILGFNISPVIKRFRNNAVSALEMESAVVDFLLEVLQRTDLSIVLIPHVDSEDGSERKSDYLFMQQLIKRVYLLSGTTAARISLAPRDLNAIQTKYLISQCRFFIGARTHATIAAWSSHVPTISISYSVKAIGLNTDLFGDLRYVLETPKLSRAALWESLEKLRADERNIKITLEQRIPEWQRRARSAVDHMLAGL
ncbi:polysaccharide pyruvyl transferase family protein [Nitrosomonas sp.]|uniref:polysaccharide pyruvyl transferase family protein n=1 Tax=Nitrosomonas sp. TaxID=42353 RepID=UPI002731C432|nr:polysaccharide pyruvyl transferase family protein [Nitrosomonas sp.]MDP2225045.1 polysaccharide pyruvyl transferase family protein [Nitrosomonas sp.]